MASYQYSQTTAGPSRPYLHPSPLSTDFDSSFPPPPHVPTPTRSPVIDSPSYSPDPNSAGGWDNPNGYIQQNGSAPVPADPKRNPLLDLMDSEKEYVDHLGLVIRRVAAAWSRKDFPPPKLDSMFRCVEAVYRANRAFGNKLRDIGPNPSSPKALGDLLMRWIDDLEAPYAKYTSTYLTGFDYWAPVTQNVLLPDILLTISSTNPPTPPLTQWSLDALFLLPYSRLRYYKKLYARLLRSTKEGRSDHRLLVVANQRLDALLSQVEERLEIDVADEQGSPDGTSGANSNMSTTMPSASSSGAGEDRAPSWAEKERQSRTSSAMNSSLDSDTGRIEDSRLSGESAATNLTHSPQRQPTITVPVMTAVSAESPPAPFSISDLELRIDTERALDLFTMTPKMNPPNLPFSRDLRSSHDVTIYFTPSISGIPIVHRRAHIFILSDLFLVADWMDASDKAARAQQVAREQPERVGQGGPMPEMWLSYPPLAGKHLMVAEGSQANACNVMIMRKETFVLHAESEMARDHIMKDLLECIEFAASVSRRNTAAVPTQMTMRSPSVHSDNRSSESGLPPQRYPSPAAFSAGSSPAISPRVSDGPEMPVPPGNGLVQQMSKITLEPGDTMNWPRGPTPPINTNVSNFVQPPYSAVGPTPTSSGGSNVLPPRGASLRQRVPSGSGPPPPPPPPLPSMGYGNHSDSALPIHGAPLPRSASGRSVSSNPNRLFEQDAPPVPVVRTPGSQYSEPSPQYGLHPPPSRSRSAEPLRPLDPPSARFSAFPTLNMQSPNGNQDDMSPPMSPVEEEEQAPTGLTGPAVISAQMKCKVFLKQSHQQWKSLGSGKLKLYVQKERNVKQLVVESDSSSKSMLISTIVLTDGVERVAKTGVAVEISDRGMRTGIIYMIQLRNENSAMGLFESLLVGSDRAVNR